MTDPYRDPPVYPCVRCDAPLAGDADALLCAAGCGRWIERAALPDAVGKLGDLDTFTGVTGSCPHCRDDLDARVWSTLRFEACNVHGIWLDAGSQPELARLLATAWARIDRITQLAELLATKKPAAYRELAERIVDLEDQVARLRR